MNVFMQELWYTDFTQQPATGWTETLSDIGGNLGLFLGASAITLFEIIVYGVKLCWTATSKSRRRLLKQRKEHNGDDSPTTQPTQHPPPSITVFADSQDHVVLKPLPIYTLDPPEDPDRHSRSSSPFPRVTTTFT